MHTKAVYRTARALVAAGLATLRFNFRGVGRSAGSFAGGAGELDDARVALTDLATRLGGVPLFLGGFSFGASVALELGAAQATLFPIRALLGIAPALTLFDFSFLATTSLPVLFVAGSADPYCPIPKLQALQARLGGRAETVLLPGAGHLLLEQLAALEEAVQSFATRYLAEPSAA